MGRKKNIDKVREFKKELSKHIPLTRVILFGSRVRARASRYSDFDLILVSPAFRKKVSFKRPVGLHQYWGLDYPVDFLCYTPEEFEKLRKQITIVRQAVEEGIEII